MIQSANTASMKVWPYHPARLVMQHENSFRSCVSLHCSPPGLIPAPGEEQEGRPVRSAAPPAPCWASEAVAPEKQRPRHRPKSQVGGGPCHQAMSFRGTCQ